MKSTIQSINSNSRNVIISSKLRIMILFVMSMFVLSFTACESSAASVAEIRAVPTNFYGVILRGNANVILNQGSETSVRIEGDPESVASVQTTIEDGALIIDGKTGFPVTVYVTVDEINLIEVDGPGKIFSKQLINSDLLLLKVSGPGTINVDVRSLSLGMVVKGNGKIYAKGSTGDSYVRVMGNGQVLSKNLDSIKIITEANAENQYQNKSNPNTEKKHGVLKLHQ